MDEEEILLLLRDFYQRANETRVILKRLGVDKEALHIPEVEIPDNIQAPFEGNAIYDALLKLSDNLALVYLQVKKDLNDRKRLSWMGTAHGIREILRGVLDLLAPNAEVEAEPWYKLEPNAKGPTHKQKTIFIMKQRKTGSKEREVAEQVEYLDERIGVLVRATYSRASDAAHRSKDREEVSRILNYFEAFAVDLLDLRQDD